VFVQLRQDKGLSVVDIADSHFQQIKVLQNLTRQRTDGSRSVFGTQKCSIDRANEKSLQKVYTYHC
jgi:hypothetical protein